jgi:hypothetical protein
MWSIFDFKEFIVLWFHSYTLLWFRYSLSVSLKYLCDGSVISMQWYWETVQLLRDGAYKEVIKSFGSLLLVGIDVVLLRSWFVFERTTRLVLLVSIFLSDHVISPCYMKLLPVWCHRRWEPQRWAQASIRVWNFQKCELNKPVFSVKYPASKIL